MSSKVSSIYENIKGSFNFGSWTLIFVTTQDPSQAKFKKFEFKLEFWKLPFYLTNLIINIISKYLN